MKRRVPGFLLVTALLLAVGAIAAACGDGKDELTLDEYFQRLQTISDDLNQRGEAFASDFEAAFDPETGAVIDIDAIQRFLSEGASAFKDAVNDVESLDPPPEVENAHNEFLQAARARVDLVEDLADRAAEVESVFDLEEALTELAGPEIEGADTQFEDACRALQQIAGDRGIQVDLDCG